MQLKQPGNKSNKLPVSALRNLGSKSALLLGRAGIATLEELRELGAIKAYLRVKVQHPKQASLNLLWALAAGLEDRDWRSLTKEEKNSLRLAVQKLGLGITGSVKL